MSVPNAIMDLVEMRRSSPVMVGRSAELDELRGALKSVSSHGAGTWVLGGEAGIGKTRLLQEFAAEATDAGAQVLVGHAVELGTDGLPFAPIAGVVRAMLAAVGADTLLEWAGPGRDALAGLGVIGELNVAAEADDADASARGRLFEVVTVLLERAAERAPVVLLLEDLHWADASTRDLLRYLLRALGAARVLIVASYRTDELHRGHPLRRFLADLERLPGVRRIELDRLDEGLVGELVERLLRDGDRPDAALLARICDRSEGIPFFVEELLDAELCGGEGVLPDSLRDVLLVRFEQLATSTQEVLRLLSVGGSRVDHAMLVAVSDLAEAELDAPLREAVSANLLRIEEDGYAFRHALVREALHGDLLPGEHMRRHVRYAEVLESRPELAGRGRAASETAYHWSAAHDTERAFRAYLRAAEEARRHYALGEAERAGERAAELWDQLNDPEQVAGFDHAELLVRTARSAADTGNYDRALALIKAALEEVGHTDPLRRADMLWRKARYLISLSKPGGWEALEEALGLVPDDPPSRLRAMLLDMKSRRLMLDARFGAAIEVAEQTMTVAAAIDDDELMGSALNVRGTARSNLFEVDEGLADLERSRELVADVSRQMRYYTNASDANMLYGRYARAVEIAEVGMERAQALGYARTSGSMLAGNAVEPLLALGEWRRAEELLDWASKLMPPFNHQLHHARMRTWLRLWRGEVDEAVEELSGLRRLAAGRHIEPQLGLSLARVVAEVDLALDRPAQAWSEATESLIGSPVVFPGHDLPLLAVAARALAAGARAGVVKPADVADQLAELRGRVEALAGLEIATPWRALFDAELSGPDGIGDDADAWRRAAEAVADPLAPVLLRAYVAYRLGETLVTAGERVDATTALAEAAERADELGADLIGTWARDLAGRARIRLVDRSAEEAPPAGAADGSPGVTLTDREAQVLDLLAAGLSNRQIGERLYISGKTASVHVSNILAKLRASSRTEAAHLARQAGLLDAS